uniref:KEN domain-containing protein n=1 Tax=Macrostomum lignano TaxID=282301 RepID=A0A1I8FM97_9PLAT
MHFLTEASDRTDKLPMDDPLMERMESCAPTVCGTDWSDRLDIQVYDNLVTFRGYRTHRLVDLLRAIRNKRNHFRELSPLSAPACQQPDCSEIPPQPTAAKRLLTEAFRRLIARRGRSSAAPSDMSSVKSTRFRQRAGNRRNVGPCGSGLPSLFKIAAYAKIAKESGAVGAVEPPGLSGRRRTCWQSGSCRPIGIDQQPLIDSDADPSVIFSADSYSPVRYRLLSTRNSIA